MRYSQILLEFNVEMTTASLGKKLLTRLKSNDTFYSVLTPASSAARAELGIVSNAAFLEPNMKKIIEKLQLETCVREIAAFDPTPNNSYSRWLCLRFVDGGIPLWDDLVKAKNFLTTFHRLKTGGYFKRNPEKSHLSDIGRFRTLSDLGEFVMSIPDTDAASNAETDRKLGERLVASGEARVILDTPRFKVTVPMTADAAAFFGRNTQWCTTAENGNQFEYYNGLGSLYIILDKPSNRRWQFHFQTKQFMDENDRPVRHSRLDRFSGNPRVSFDMPPEFFEVMPTAMLINGFDSLEITDAQWARFTADDFVGVDQTTIYKIARTSPNPNVKKLAIGAATIQTCAIIFAWSRARSSTATQEMQTFVKKRLMDYDLKVERSEHHGVQIVSGTALDVVVTDLKNEKRTSDIWRFVPTRFNLIEPEHFLEKSLVSFTQSNKTVFVFRSLGAVYYIVVGADGRMDDKVHGFSIRDWADTRLDTLVKDGRNGRVKGMDAEMAEAIAEKMSTANPRW